MDFGASMLMFVCAHVRGAYDKFPDFFRIGTFIDSTYIKL